MESEYGSCGDLYLSSHDRTGASHDGTVNPLNDTWVRADASAANQEASSAHGVLLRVLSQAPWKPDEPAPPSVSPLARRDQLRSQRTSREFLVPSPMASPLTPPLVVDVSSKVGAPASALDEPTRGQLVWARVPRRVIALVMGCVLLALALFALWQRMRPTTCLRLECPTCAVTDCRR